jgi:hypothetical protein
MERVRYGIIAPVAFRVPSGEGRYSILLQTKGGTLMMDPKGGVVLRIFTNSQEFHEVVEVRSVMSPYVASPAFEVEEEGRSFKEALVVGSWVRGLAPMARAATWRRLTRSYADLAKVRARDYSGDIVTTALAAAMKCEIPTDLAAVLERDGGELMKWAGRQPLVPAHGDLSADNLIVDSAGAPFLIDFEARCVGLLPFFHDPLLLVVREANCGMPDLLGRIMSGEEDDVLACLWQMAGARCSADDVRFALLSVLLIHVHRRDHRPGPPDSSRFQHHLEWMWRSLASYLLDGYGRPRKVGRT